MEGRSVAEELPPWRMTAVQEITAMHWPLLDPMRKEQKIETDASDKRHRFRKDELKGNATLFVIRKV